MSIIAVSVLVAACSTSGVTPVPATAAPTAALRLVGPGATSDLFGNARLDLAGGKDGVTEAFSAVPGRYMVSANVVDGARGCAFSMLLENVKDGPIIESLVFLISGTAGIAHHTEWTLTAGTYVLQEDRSGTLNCRRAFTAEVTAE